MRLPGLLVGPAGAWKRLLAELDTEKTRELMSHYYGNLALMSALLIAISFTVMVEIEANDDFWSTAAVVTGIASFGFLLGCVVEAVFIDNGVTKCATKAELGKYIEEHPLYLGWPSLLFISGLVMGLLEFFLWIVSKFHAAISVYTLFGGLVFLALMTNRFMQQSKFFMKLEKEFGTAASAPLLNTNAPKSDAVGEYPISE